jgi:hypothetical protein
MHRNNPTAPASHMKVAGNNTHVSVCSKDAEPRTSGHIFIGLGNQFMPFSHYISDIYQKFFNPWLILCQQR